MGSVELTRRNGSSVLTLTRPPVNALDEGMVDELAAALAAARDDVAARALVVTGRGPFFSFGFDVPALVDGDRADFERFLAKFTGLYTDLFTFPKPVIAAINGHAIGAGCMLATACDRRFMVPGRARIALNEIGFGASVFAGTVEMLAACVGQRRAEDVLYGGTLYSAGDADLVDLVDQVVTASGLDDLADEEAARLSRNLPAFAAMKALLRGPTAERMRAREPAAIREFVEIWYSDATREQLRKIEIRDRSG